MLGEKLRELREAQGLLQRQVAAKLEVDTAYICKMESNEKPVSRNYLKKLSNLFKISEKELETLWLAEKIFNTVKNERNALNAIKIAKENIKSVEREKIKC